MKITQIYDFLNSYNKQSGINLFRFFLRRPVDQYVRLLQQFVDTRRCAKSSDNNDESNQGIELEELNTDKSEISEQDISFIEFEDYLNERNQFVMFICYLIKQSWLSSEKQDYAYKQLFSVWRAEEAPDLNNFLYLYYLLLKQSCSDIEAFVKLPPIGENIIATFSVLGSWFCYLSMLHPFQAFFQSDDYSENSKLLPDITNSRRDGAIKETNTENGIIEANPTPFHF